MRMTAGNIVFFTYSQDIVDCFRNHRMLVVSGMTQFLTQIPFSNKDNADSGYFLQDPRQIINRPGIFTLDDYEYFSFRRERPNISAVIILLLAESPIAR